MRKYSQLTQDQRYQIYAFLKVNLSMADIAKEIGVHKSTISREIRRNKGKKGYRPKQANIKACTRRSEANKFIKLTPELIDKINQLIRYDLSPEQVSGYLKRNDNIQISHETIYKYLITNKAQRGTLYKHLRRFNKKYKKRYGAYDRRGQIPDRVSIDHRPAIVDTKKRIGDWETDTIIGKNHKGVVLTIVERKTKLTLMQKLPYKRSDLVADAIIKLLLPYRNRVHTITTDNGKEFSNHKDIAKKLGANIYFAHPYRSWERGLNENTNGLIRQYFPKKLSFNEITDKNVQFVMNRLNNRPRKLLDFATPNELFLGHKIKLAA